MSYLKNAAQQVGTPTQAEPLDEKQVPNSAGGYSYPVTDWTRLERFLILGSEGGSYYASEKKLTKENAKTVQNCIKKDGERVVRTVVEISDKGRAPKNDPALFVLALCAAAPEAKTRAAALLALPKVARIGTHLFHFAEYVNTLRGWGRGLRTAVRNWYLERPLEMLQNQLVKYQARDGWSHRDLLRLSHPKPNTSLQSAAFSWSVGKEKRDSELRLISAFEEAKKLTLNLEGFNGTSEERDIFIKKHVKENEKSLAELIRKYELTREMLPTEYLNSLVVWEALFEKMPMTAMIRNLANMTRIGLLAPMSATVKEVCSRLTDSAALKKARVHPIQLLVAMKTYEAGHGIRSKGEGWTPVPQVVDALDEAFYLAFDNVEPTGKRIYLGLDISGSMWGGEVAGVPGFTPAEASGAMAMVTVKSEKEYYAAGFTSKQSGRYGGMWDSGNTEMTPISFSKKQRLDDVLKITKKLSERMGGTDCALPMLDAIEKKIPVDTFIIYTDSETWAGDVHPSQALAMYRKKMGIPAKLIVVGLVANDFTIADPTDAGQLDVVGFDTAAPAVMANFMKD